MKKRIILGVSIAALVLGAAAIAAQNAKPEKPGGPPKTRQEQIERMQKRLDAMQKRIDATKAMTDEEWNKRRNGALKAREDKREEVKKLTPEQREQMRKQLEQKPN